MPKVLGTVPDEVADPILIEVFGINGHSLKVMQRGVDVNATELTGIAAAKGTARGTARVLSSSDELYRLSPSDVLGCESTSPNWTRVRQDRGVRLRRRRHALARGNRGSGVRHPDSHSRGRRDRHHPRRRRDRGRRHPRHCHDPQARRAGPCPPLFVIICRRRLHGVPESTRSTHMWLLESRIAGSSAAIWRAAVKYQGAGAWATGQKPTRTSSRTGSGAEEGAGRGPRRAWAV